MKIKTMLITSMIIFSLLSALLFTIFVSGSFSDSSEHQYHEMMKIMTVKQSDSLEVFLDSYAQRIVRIAGNPAVADFIASVEAENARMRAMPLTDTIDADARTGEDEENIILAPELKSVEHVLNILMHDGSGITGITIFNDRSEVILSVGSDQSDFILSAKRQRLGENHFGTVHAPDSSDLNPLYEIIQYSKVSSEHYILCTYSSNDMKSLFERSKLPTSGKLMLICPLRNLIDQTLRGNIDESNLGAQEYSRIITYLKEPKYHNGENYFSFEAMGRIMHHALFTEVGETGWLLGVVVKDSDIYVHSDEAVSSLVGVTVLMGLLMIALAILFAFWFTKPLNVIKNTLFNVRRGEHELRVDIGNKNEYGVIATEFNALLDNVVVGEGRYKTVIEMSNNIIFEWNFNTDTVTFSNNFGKKFSYRAPSDSYNDSFLVKCKVHPEDTDNYKQTLDRLSKGEAIQQDEFRWKNVFGDYIWVLMRACPIHDAEGKTIKVVGVIIDIDRAKKSEKILSARASYDALTGLYNRETLENLINNEIDLIAARKNEFAILFIDVDDFKFFNDNYSHATGDQVLKFTAITINDIVGKYGLAGRFGGDEFVVCVRNAQINDPARSAEEILAKLKEGFDCDVGDRLSVNVSIGIAIVRDTTKRIDEIIGMADDAMYQIKKSGKSNYGFINQ